MSPQGSIWESIWMQCQLPHSFHSNYGSILLSFQDITMRQTTDGQTRATITHVAVIAINDMHNLYTGQCWLRARLLLCVKVTRMIDKTGGNRWDWQWVTPGNSRGLQDGERRSLVTIGSSLLSRNYPLKDHETRPGSSSTPCVTH